MSSILSVESSQNNNSLLTQRFSVNAASTTSNSSGSGDSATISANDFLVLLVTEMQNQDPTASTDPNEYINQLVNVNSLQQLVSINQTLSDALGSSNTSTSNDTASAGSASSAIESAAAGTVSANTGSVAGGNLGIPAESNAAERLSMALGSVRS